MWLFLGRVGVVAIFGNTTRTSGPLWCAILTVGKDDLYAGHWGKGVKQLTVTTNKRIGQLQCSLPPPTRRSSPLRCAILKK